MNVALVFPLNTLHPGSQRTMPANAWYLGMIKGKRWVVLAFRNNSTLKILTFRNLDTSDTCSSWIKRFVLKSDEDGERKNKPFFLRGNQPWGYLRYLPPDKKGPFCSTVPCCSDRPLSYDGSVTLRPAACIFGMPTNDFVCVCVCVSVSLCVCVIVVVKRRTLPPIFLLSKRFGIGQHGCLPADAYWWSCKEICQIYRATGLGDSQHQSIIWLS